MDISQHEVQENEAEFDISGETLTITELDKAKKILEMMRNDEFNGGFVIFDHIEFTGYTFQNIKEVKFQECIFRHCSFENMKEVKFYLSYIYNSRMLEDLISIHFSRTTISNVDFIEVEMGRIDFCDVSFREVRFYRCKQKPKTILGNNWLKTTLEDNWIEFHRCQWTKNQDIKFIDCDFCSIDIFECNETGFVFNNLKCIPKASDIIKKYFKTTNQGIIAYKVFNQYYPAPEDWKVEAGATITHLSNRNAYDRCGEGINVSTMNWICKNAAFSAFCKNAAFDFSDSKITIWKVLIPWKEAVGITVPYDFEGKIRCESIKLLEPLTEEEATEICALEDFTSKEEN